MKELMAASETLLGECQRLEPGHGEICGDDTLEMKVVYENTDFSVASSSRSTVLGLRVIVDQRMGFVTTNNLSEKELKEKAKEAQLVARLSPPSPHHDIAPKEKRSPAFSLVDDKLKNLSAKQMLELCDLLISEAKSDPRVSIDRAQLGIDVSNRLVQNSNGVLQKKEQTVCYWSVMGMAKQGSEVTSFDYDGNCASQWSGIDKKIITTAKEFRDSVIGNLGATTAKSYKGPVLFHPAAVESLIGDFVAFNVNARYQQDGMSKWAKSQGQKISSEIFSLSEDPLDTDRPGEWTPFDREGVLTSKHEIIKQGTLNFTAHNAFTAKRAGVPLTGNASGGSRSISSIGLNGLSVSQGSASQQDLYSALNTGLVLKRFSGNTDPVSGQFSGVAKNSWWTNNGRRSGPLKEIMVSGNIFDLLQNIKLVGSESFTQSGSFRSPYLLVDGVSVTSA